MQQLQQKTVSTHIGSLLLISVLSLCLILIATMVSKNQSGQNHTIAHAQTSTCTLPFQPVATPLTDLGTNEYFQRSRTSPPTYTPTGEIGGLYGNGSNTRPPAHDATGLALAAQITPLDANGNPDVDGKIGMTSIGMSNTNSEFGRFVHIANDDPQKNPSLKIINGASGGGTVERWIDPDSTIYWDLLDDRIAGAGLTDEQIQVIWVKITQAERNNFPISTQLFQSRLEELSRMLKAKFPNLKITYFSSRTRSYALVNSGVGEPGAYENAFAIRWMINKQISGDPSLNFDPNNGPAPVSYMAWGPYLWIDGMNPRMDGRVWPATNLMSDCVHPSPDANQDVADMLLDFFKSDTTATPWFLAPGTPVSPTPTPGQGTPTHTPTPTDIPTVTPTHSPTPTITPTPDAPTSTPPAGDGELTHWSFDTNSVDPVVGSCSGCFNNGASWTESGRVGGAFNFNGTSDYIDLGNFPYLNDTNAFTIALWINPDFNQTHTTSRYVLSGQSGLQLFYLSNIRDWRFVTRTSNGTIRVDTQSLTWVSNTWHHMAITYDGTQLKFYWDGSPVATSQVAGTVSTAMGSTRIGGAVVNSNYFPGAIDELRVYRERALTELEIENLAFGQSLLTYR